MVVSNLPSGIDTGDAVIVDEQVFLIGGHDGDNFISNTLVSKVFRAPPR